VAREVLSLPPPTFDDPRSDLERVRQQLGKSEIPLSVLSRLTDVLREGDFAATITRNGGTVVDVAPLDVDARVFGAAVDLGTSKIIAYLVDLRDGRLVDQEAIENPQMRLGEDVVTRITGAIEDGKLDELAQAVREGVNEAIETLCTRHQIPPHAIYDMTVVGNTAMHHLALGLSPLGLASAPFVPALDEPLNIRSSDLGLTMNPEGLVYFLPPIAGFVGSDCLGVIAATRLASRRRPTTAIDIGTNTET
jgi:uncharacterized 2Fe-2S/4Fe-4S cluster protein (DUF4445 family)